MSVTETILIPPYGHTLAATLREVNANGIASRIELVPAAPFAGDLEFDTAANLLVAPGAWSTVNTVDSAVLDTNTSRKSYMYFEYNTTAARYWYGAVRTAPFAYQVATGDFDVYSAVRFGRLENYGTQVTILAQSTTNADDFVAIQYQHRGADGVFSELSGFIYSSTDNTVGSYGVWNPGTHESVGARLYVRMKRAGNVFTFFGSLDGKNWTQVGTVTRNDFSTGTNLGLTMSQEGSTHICSGSADFLRNWPPYVTTSPVSTLVSDSGISGSIWTPSTFVALENPPLDPFGVQTTIGLGTLKYRIAAGESNPPTLSGAALTEAQVQALSPITGRYLNIEVTFISANGYELASWAGAKINRTIPHFLLVHPGMAGMRG